MKEAEAAVAIVQARAPRDSALLIRRASRKDDSWSGHWAFPGGRRAPEDRDPLDTALRELAEECAVRIGREDLAAEMPARFARRRVGAYVPVTPFVFGVPSELPAVPDAREVAEAVWLPLAELRAPANHQLLPVPGRPAWWRFPAIALNSTPLWGFTYRLVCDWLEVGPKPEEYAQAGFDAARLVLQFLLAHGLTLGQDWRRRRLGKGRPATVAQVSGPIPAKALLERFSGAGSHVMGVNCLDARADRVRLLGRRYEEYLIQAQA